jgi:hypothetical protein
VLGAVLSASFVCALWGFVMRVVSCGSVSLSGLEFQLSKPGSSVYARRGGLMVDVIPPNMFGHEGVRHQYTCWLPTLDLQQILNLCVDLEEQYYLPGKEHA